MPRISSLSLSKNQLFSLSIFHSPVPLFMSSQTRALVELGFSFEITLYVHGLGIHLSCHTLILFPFPTYHLMPLCTMLCAAIKLLHAQDGLRPIVASAKLQCGKYFALYTRLNRELELVKSRHPCLAKRAKLKLLKSRKPSPPLSSGTHIASQLNHAVFFSFPV